MPDTTTAGVLFDIDDTLIDYQGSERAGLLAHLAAEGLLEAFASPGQAAQLWRRLVEEHYDRYLAGELTAEQQRIDRARAFLAYAGTPRAATMPEPEIAAWTLRYARLVRAHIRAFPDTAPVLDLLAGRYRLGIVSNGHGPDQRAKLTAAGLLNHWDAWLCSAQFGAAKPDPRIFRAACAELGLPAHQVVYVGDRYDTDALGAHRAGLHGLWLNRNYDAVPAGGTHAHIRVLPGLYELPDALEHLEHTYTRSC